MIKNRLRNLVIFLITTGLILILNSSISFSQDTDNQNTQNAQLPCQESESCVFLDDQFLFGIYPDVSDEESIEQAKEIAKQRAKNVSYTIKFIADNLLIDTNQIFTDESNTCFTDENGKRICEAIIAYIQTNGASENLITINQTDVIQTNNNQQSNLESPLDLANKYKKNIQTQIILYRSVFKDNGVKSIGTIILLLVCFILIFHQLFLNQIDNFVKDVHDSIVSILLLISKNKKDNNKSLGKEEVEQTTTEFKVGNKTKDDTVIKEVYFRNPDYVIYRTKNTIRWDINETQINHDNSYNKDNKEKDENIYDLYIYAILKGLKSLALCIAQKIMLEIRLELLNLYKYEKEEMLDSYYNKVQQELSKIESKQPAQIENTETINIVVAHGIKLALDGEISEAKEVFKIADQRLDQFRKKYNTLKYLNGSFTVVLCFLFAILLLAILPKLFSNLFYNIFTILGISEQFIPVIIYGGLGGFLSVSSRNRDNISKILTLTLEY